VQSKLKKSGIGEIPGLLYLCKLSIDIQAPDCYDILDVKSL
jgi:hypothetical protein